MVGNKKNTTDNLDTIMAMISRTCVTFHSDDPVKKDHLVFHAAFSAAGVAPVVRGGFYRSTMVLLYI